MTEIDTSPVKMVPVREGENDLEVEITTTYGVARATLDFSRDDVVGVRALLPSGREYQSDVDSWITSMAEHDPNEGIRLTMRLVATFVIRCFQKEAARTN